MDSVIDAAGDWFAPSGAEPTTTSPRCEPSRNGSARSADAVLLGRLTFESFRGYWPNQTDDTTGVSDYLNQVEKYVVSSTLTEPGWEHTTILRGELADEVAALKAQPGGDIVATGSITLVHALNRTGLVDEYRLFVYPVALGHGTSGCSRNRSTNPDLKLVEAHPFNSGVVLLRYRTH